MKLLLILAYPNIAAIFVSKIAIMYNDRVSDCKITMKIKILSIIVVFLCLAFPSHASIANYEEINGYVWANMDYADKTVAVITLAKEILMEGRVSSRFSPEIALILCFKTDEFYQKTSNMQISIINAWLSISRNIKTVSELHMDTSDRMMKALGLKISRKV